MSGRVEQVVTHKERNRFPEDHLLGPTLSKELLSLVDMLFNGEAALWAWEMRDSGTD